MTTFDTARNFAKVAVTGLAIAAIAISGPAIASERHHHHHHGVNGSRTVLGTFTPRSEGWTASICDGVVGFWDQIPMPGGKVYCLARSLYDPTPGDWTTVDIPTCTYTYGYGRWEKEVTKDGACPTKKSY